MYKQFLLQAEKSQLQASTISPLCSIKVVHKVSTVITRGNTVEDRNNESLSMIHSFYSKLVVNRKMLFHDLDETSRTLNHGGLISCLRDFNVIPGLLSKEDVLTIWKLMNLESVKYNRMKLFFS